MNKVSILLPIYNDEQYIAQSIDSIIKQTYNNWELLIGFNGTTDSSKEIVKNFLYDKRIIIYDFQNDKGKAKTLNKLLNYTSGQWIALQDGDDVWLPKKLEMQSAYFDKFDVIGTKCQYIDKDGNFIGLPDIQTNHQQILEQSLNGVNQVINTSTVFKKEKALEVNGWNETIDGIEDYDFWLKLMVNKNQFININKILLLHRLHQRSNFNTKTFDLNQLIKKYNNAI